MVSHTFSPVVCNCESLAIMVPISGFTFGSVKKRSSRRMEMGCLVQIQMTWRNSRLGIDSLIDLDQTRTCPGKRLERLGIRQVRFNR